MPAQLTCRLLCLTRAELCWVQDKGKQTGSACSAGSAASGHAGSQEGTPALSARAELELRVSQNLSSAPRPSCLTLNVLLHTECSAELPCCVLIQLASNDVS